MGAIAHYSATGQRVFDRSALGLTFAALYAMAATGVIALQEPSGGGRAAALGAFVGVVLGTADIDAPALAWATRALLVVFLVAGFRLVRSERRAIRSRGASR